MKILRQEERVAGNTCMLYGHGDGTASVWHRANQRRRRGWCARSSDATKAVADFARGQFRTMGFCFLYAVGGGQVVQLMKRGHFAQRDVRSLVDAGFTEFFYSSAFATKSFMLPDGTIVGLSREIDCSPAATTADARRWQHVLGHVDQERD